MRAQAEEKQVREEKLTHGKKAIQESRAASLKTLMDTPKDSEACTQGSGSGTWPRTSNVQEEIF